MRRALILTATTIAAAGTLAAVGLADTQTLRDRKGETKGLREQPELDIIKARAGHTPDGRLKHSVKVAGKLKPKKVFTRPFLLINTNGGNRGKAEFVLLNKKIFKRTRNDEFKRVGTATFKWSTRRRTYVWKFDPRDINSNNKNYGWLARTFKRGVGDQVPRNRFQVHRQ